MSAVSVTKMEPQQALMIATVACVCLHVRVNALLVLWAHKLGFFFFQSTSVHLSLYWEQKQGPQKVYHSFIVWKLGQAVLQISTTMNVSRYSTLKPNSVCVFVNWKCMKLIFNYTY